MGAGEFHIAPRHQPGPGQAGPGQLSPSDTGTGAYVTTGRAHDPCHGAATVPGTPSGSPRPRSRRGSDEWDRAGRRLQVYAHHPCPSHAAWPPPKRGAVSAPAVTARLGWGIPGPLQETEPFQSNLIATDTSALARGPTAVGARPTGPPGAREPAPAAPRADAAGGI